MKFVKNHAGNVRQIGGILQHAGEHALGNDFYTGIAAHMAFVAHAVAHKAAGLFAQQGRHIARQCAGGHTAGFKQQNAAALKPWLIHKPQGHAAALARAGQGAEHKIAALRQRRQNFWPRNIKRAGRDSTYASRSGYGRGVVGHGTMRQG